jgi:mono/diheme cytochrome c family protein
VTFNLQKGWVLLFAITLIILLGSGLKGSPVLAMEKQKEEQKSDKPAEEQKLNQPVEEQKTEKPAEEQKSEEKKLSMPIPSSNPLSGKPEAIEAGRKLYFTWCTQCHGPKANGESRFGSYAADLRKFWRGYNEFVTIVKNGRPQRQMPPWKEVLNDQQISQIGAYLETLAIEGANWKDPGK